MSDLDSSDPLCNISSIREAQVPLFRNVNAILMNRLLRAVLTSLGLVVVSYVVLRFTGRGGIARAAELQDRDCINQLTGDTSRRLEFQAV